MGTSRKRVISYFQKFKITIFKENHIYSFDIH